jgi:hypothetical protein
VKKIFEDHKPRLKVHLIPAICSVDSKYFQRSCQEVEEIKRKVEEKVSSPRKSGIFKKSDKRSQRQTRTMDNPNFGSSHLSSPALVVFSQAANGLSDALRLQRPFHSQLQDAKDLHHLSLVSSYGTHLLHGFQPHFLHQHLNPAVSSANSSPFGSGGAFVKPFPSNLSLPSAFAPPKCLGFGLEQVSISEAAAGDALVMTDDD